MLKYRLHEFPCVRQTYSQNHGPLVVFALFISLDARCNYFSSVDSWTFFILPWCCASISGFFWFLSTRFSLYLNNTSMHKSPETVLRKWPLILDLCLMSPPRGPTSATYLRTYLPHYITTSIFPFDVFFQRQPHSHNHLCLKNLIFLSFFFQPRNPSSFSFYLCIIDRIFDIQYFWMSYSFVNHYNIIYTLLPKSVIFTFQDLGKLKFTMLSLKSLFSRSLIF